MTNICLNYMALQQPDLPNRFAALGIWEHLSELHGLAVWCGDYKLRCY
jgi:hypothetical protein